MKTGVQGHLWFSRTLRYDRTWAENGWKWLEMGSKWPEIVHRGYLVGNVFFRALVVILLLLNQRMDSMDSMDSKKSYYRSIQSRIGMVLIMLYYCIAIIKC